MTFEDVVTPFQDPVWVDGVTPLNSVNMTKLQTRDEKNAPSGYVGLDSGSNVAVVGYLRAATVSSSPGTINEIDLWSDGKIYFGSAGDTTLYRAAADMLTTDDLFIGKMSIYSQPAAANGGFVFNPGTVGGNPLLVQIQGEANPRFYINVAGNFNWGPGGATAIDTNLYRAAAGDLRTDGNFRAGNSMVVDQNSGGSKLYFGSALDTNLYRHAAGMLRTNGYMIVDGQMYVDFGNTSQRLWFGSAADTGLYRNVAGQLKTDGGFYAVGKVGFHWNGAGWAVETAANGLLFQADTNLYRSAAGVLRTDGSLVVAGDPGLGSGWFALAVNLVGTGLKQFAVGAPDSGGAGWRVVTVPN